MCEDSRIHLWDDKLTRTFVFAITLTIVDDLCFKVYSQTNFMSALVEILALQ